MKTKNKRVISIILSAILVILSISMPVYAVADEIATAEDGLYNDLLYESHEWAKTLPRYVSPGASSENDMTRSVSETEDETPLPSSVDLSTSPYFPAIGDQGDTKACTAFATTYYQYTYEANKLQNIITTPQNTYCPQFTYSNRSVSQAISFDEAYRLLNIFGCLKYSDYDSSVDFSDLNTFDYYVSNNTAAKLRATKLNIEPLYITELASHLENGVWTPVITFDTGADTDDTLIPLKQALNDGKVLTISVKDAVTEETISTPGENYGETIIVRGRDSFHRYTHALTIVGYDDNISFDCNGDGIIESAERGAFKVADSYGTDEWNDGYVWILYDAFNYTSQNSDPTWESKYNTQRKPLLLEFNYSGLHYFYIDVFCINVSEHKSMFILKIDVQSSDYFRLTVHPERKANDGLTNYVYSLKRTASSNFEQVQYTGSIIVDYTTLYNPISTYKTGYEWGAMFSYTDPTKHNITSMSVVDDLGNVICSIDPGTLPTLTGSATYSVFENIDIELGDLNYDGVIDADDVSALSDGLSEGLSNLQSYLADLNEDGRISSRDLILLKLLVNEDVTLTEAEMQLFSDYEFGGK